GFNLLLEMPFIFPINEVRQKRAFIDYIKIVQVIFGIFQEFDLSGQISILIEPSTGWSSHPI
ncbi:MAG: hypothetical protein ACXWRA_14285, partial [Pseudobdellovibrionaceae bacterium]